MGWSAGSRRILAGLRGTVNYSYTSYTDFKGHTPVVAVAILLASSPLAAVLALSPVGHATQLVGFRVGRERHAVEHRVGGNRGSPSLGIGQRGHEVQ
jgi:hypothetical protein